MHFDFTLDYIENFSSSLVKWLTEITFQIVCED